MSNVGELNRVPLREQWPNEEQDFTPWLADNISYLAETLDMELAVERKEKTVGEFFTDIHAKVDTGEEIKDVVIENQYNETDHEHLGKSIVYGGGIDADIIIWIAEEFKDGHIDAIQWLNERTGDDTGIFGVRIELVQINESPMAPIFSVVERPSRWKQLTGGMEENDRKHYRFWKRFVERLENEGLERYAREPRPVASYNVPDDFDDANIRLAASAYHNRIECALRISDPDGELGGLDGETVREKLRSKISEMDAQELDASVVETIEIQKREGMKTDRITIYYPGDFERDNTDYWNEYHSWLIDAMCVYDEAFGTWFN
jgi:hypothetical protein